MIIRRGGLAFEAMHPSISCHDWSPLQSPKEVFCNMAVSFCLLDLFVSSAWALEGPGGEDKNWRNKTSMGESTNCFQNLEGDWGNKPLAQCDASEGEKVRILVDTRVFILLSNF